MQFALEGEKKIVLHIGPPKTGSSAIQKFLLDNINLLAEQGIFYPSHTVDKNGVSSGNQDALLSPNCNNELVIDREKIAKLLERFNQSTANTLLLSSEAFFRRANTLIRILPNCEAIAFVRNPIDFIQSIYNQSVKRHMNADKMKLPQCIGTYQFDKLSELIERNRSKSVQLYAYNKNRNVVETMASILGLKGEFNSSPIINSSYTHQALQFKRIVNSFQLKSLDSALDYSLQTYSSNYTEYSYIPKNIYLRYQTSVRDALTKFCECHVVKGSEFLFDELSTSRTVEYKEQSIRLAELKGISDFLRKEHFKVYLKLRRSLITRKASSVEAAALTKTICELGFVAKSTSFWRIILSLKLTMTEKFKWIFRSQ